MKSTARKAIFTHNDKVQLRHHLKNTNKKFLLRNRKMRTARGVLSLSVSRKGGEGTPISLEWYPYPVGGYVYPVRGRGLRPVQGYCSPLPLEGTWAQGTWAPRLRYPSPGRGLGPKTGVPPRMDLGPETGVPTPLEGTWDQRLAYSPCGWTDTCENITFPRTLYAGGNESDHLP